MARPKEFNREEVIDRAIDVFWSKGFKATSIQDLVEATEINRGSLYNTFGDKAGLFDAAMTRYAEFSPARYIIDNAETGEPRATIQALFDRVVDRNTRSSDRRGCLVTNTATGLTSRDKAVAKRIRESLTKLENALFTLIQRGQELGEISPARDSRELARFLVGAAQGLQVMAKVNPDPDYLRAIANTALSSLD